MAGLKLYFLRHGQAGDRDEWKGDDAARPLTPEGKRRMKREAAAIRRLDPGLDAIVTSPLVRAHATAEIVADALGIGARLVADPRLAPGFGPKQLQALIAAQRGAAALMLVGHEPDFSQTITHLIGGGRLDVKKGALALVELEDRATLAGRLVWLIPPKALDR
jgi:phosphohistidine phosphatase